MLPFSSAALTSAADVLRCFTILARSVRAFRSPRAAAARRSSWRAWSTRSFRAAGTRSPGQRGAASVGSMAAQTFPQTEEQGPVESNSGP